MTEQGDMGAEIVRIGGTGVDLVAVDDDMAALDRREGIHSAEGRALAGAALVEKNHSIDCRVEVATVIIR